MRLRRLRSGLCAAVVIGTFASRAIAAPALIKVFEAKAHEAPSDDSPVVQTFPEEAKVSVSEEATDGWRRVRLPDGRTAFIHDAEIALEERAPAPYPAPATAATTLAPTVQRTRAPLPQIYVKDLSHLAELVKPDNVVYPKAKELADRRNMSIAVSVVTGVAGIALMIGAATFLAGKDCTTGAFNDQLCTTKINMPLLIVGATGGLLGPLIGYAVTPSRNDVLDVVNLWNTRHVEQPFTIEHQPALAH